MIHSGGTLPKMSFAPMKEELSRYAEKSKFMHLLILILFRTLPTKGFTSLADSYHERFPDSNMLSNSSRLSESNAPQQTTRNHSSSGNTTAPTSISKNSAEMERKSSERPSQRDRRDRYTLQMMNNNGQTYKTHIIFRVDQSNMSLDSSLTMMDDTVNSSILNRSSLLEALKHEKESRPESFWRV